MRIEGNAPLGLNSLQTNSATVMTQANEFGSSSLTTEKKDDKGTFSKVISGILYIPKMILSGTWTFVKYAIYFGTCGICCKPGYDPKVLKDALLKVRDAQDKGAEWSSFVKNYPRAVDQLTKWAIEVIRAADLGSKEDRNPKKVADWNKENLEAERQKLFERFNAQDADLLTNAIDYLQQQIDSNAKK